MNMQQRSSWWKRNWKWVVPVGCLTPVLMCGGFFVLIFSLVFGLLKSSDAYTDSLAAARSSTQLQAALGTPIEPGFLVMGDIEVSGSEGFADITYNIFGPNGEATMFVVAYRSAGQWTYETLVAEIETTGDQIDLLAGNQP